jgi:predicted Zn-dependent protease
LGINPETNIRALYKITRLNRMVMKLGRVDEKLQTHPSTAKRIVWLAEKGNISEDRIETLKNEADEEISELL